MFELTDELFATLLESESARVEWKSGAGGDALPIVKTIAAFANDYEGVNEGYVVCGVEDDGTVTGLTDVEALGLRKKVSSNCERHLQPPVFPEWQKRAVDDDPSRVVLVFRSCRSAEIVGHRVKESRAKGDSLTHWIRTNDEVKPAPANVIRELLRVRGGETPFLDRPRTDASVADLDHRTLEQIVRDAELPLAASEYLEPERPIETGSGSLCVRIGSRIVPTNLAIVLIGREPAQFVRGCRVIISVYPGTQRDTDLTEKVELDGTIPWLLEKVKRELERHLVVDIDKRRPLIGEGQNRARYSATAVDEAVVNAMIHRDYEEVHPTRITVFSDRIEVSSPGGLAAGLDPKKVTAGRSHAAWRNESLRAFMLRIGGGVAQAEGQGIPAIIRMTEKVSGRRPTFEIDPGWFTVKIPARMNGRIVATEEHSSPKTDVPPAPDGGIVVISMGDSVLSRVEVDAERLGLDGLPILADVMGPKWLDAEEDAWREQARLLWRRLDPICESAETSEIHLFFKGPVALAMIVGALVIHRKPLHVYHFDDRRGYFRALTLDRRFLVEGE